MEVVLIVPNDTIMETASLKLLGTKLSPFSFRVEWALKLKGIDYEFVEEDLFNKSPLLLQSNPVYKLIPVLIHARKPIPESTIILEYIDEIWKENPILPNDPLERAHARFWAKFMDDKFLGASNKAFSTTGQDQAKAVESMAEALRLLEGEIKGKFFGGERIGYLDIVVGWIAYWFELVEEAAGFKVLDANKYPSLHSWMKNFIEVPVIKENLPSRHNLRQFFRDIRQVMIASLNA